MNFNAKKAKDAKTQRKEVMQSTNKQMATLENELSYKILGAAIEVHTVLGGPGLLESIYESALIYELQLRGLKIQTQVPIQVSYKNKIVQSPLVLDILVEDRVIVEVKATEKESSIYKSQLLTYLRLTSSKLGLLINFGNSCLRDGIYRVVNGM